MSHSTDCSDVGTGMLSESVSVDVETGSGRMEIHLCRPLGEGSYPACILLPEIFGVTDDILAAADTLVRMGQIVAIPDLHHRTAPRTVLPTDADGRIRGLELLQQMTREHVIDDLTVVRNYLAAQDDYSGELSVLGFSAGGHIAYLAATALDLRAAIVLYGGWIGNTGIPLSQPEPTVELTPQMKDRGVRLLYIVGADDHLIRADECERIERSLKQANVDHELIVYPDVQHGFMFAGRAAYNATAQRDAWEHIARTLAF